MQILERKIVFIDVNSEKMIFIYCKIVIYRCLKFVFLPRAHTPVPL